MAAEFTPDDFEIRRGGGWWYVVNKVTGVAACKCETKPKAEQFLGVLRERFDRLN